MRRALAGSVLALLLLALAAAWPGAARAADGLSVDDRAEIRRVILDQLAAFRRDDGETAFRLASPGIQETFATADVFMAMVREGYQPVYRPRVFEFGAAQIGPLGPEQRVFVVGPDGLDWIAVYPMEKQPDGRWRVNGCFLKRPESA